MDNELARLVDLDTPKLNPDIADGLAVKHLAEAEDYIDMMWRAVARNFPPGLVYVRGERCTPHEAYAEETRKRFGRRQIDISESNVYLMRYVFRYHDEIIHHYAKLPYVLDGGVINMGGARFTIAPVIADRVISIGDKDVFIRFVRTLMIVERTGWDFVAITDGERKKEFVDIAWSKIHHSSKGDAPTVKAKSSLIHYLFCKHGLYETFLRYGRCNPVFGTVETITPEAYPPDEWIICQSSWLNMRRNPSGVKSAGLYNPTQIVVAIRKSEYTPMVRNLIAGFYYVVDHFPDRILPEFLGTPNERRLWMVLMGHLLFSSNIGEGKLAEDIETHIRALDEYMDDVMKIKFAEIGMNLKDIYELFGILIEKIDDWIIGSSEHINSLYNKELSILYFVLQDVVRQIIRFYFKLNSASKKPMTAKEIEKNYIGPNLKPGAIFLITRCHSEVSTTTTSGDNKALKITTIMVPQTSTNKTGAGRDMAAITDPSKHFHVSVAEHGGYLNLPKSDPSGHARINPFTLLSPKGVLQRNPDLIELTDSIQRAISGKIAVK